MARASSSRAPKSASEAVDDEMSDGEDDKLSDTETKATELAQDMARNVIQSLGRNRRRPGIDFDRPRIVEKSDERISGISTPKLWSDCGRTWSPTWIKSQIECMPCAIES